ncbi:MAG TPA: polysaccharide biosynthesis tyrosine autokinase [Ignavibacteriaceae bacterium]|nr:polysaccharide biosynthesis tyrosine autokinase [Ignavibacteriaceae bacterium]
MNNNSVNDFEIENSESNTLKDYLILLRNNLVPVIIIIIASFAVALIYALSAKNIYKSQTAIKLSKPSGSILQSPLVPEFSDFGNDRFIANEIEILKSYNLRERVAKALVDTFVNSSDKKDFNLLYKKEFSGNSEELLTVPQIAALLSNTVNIEQKRGLDIIEISAESPSPIEAALIANIYSKEYKNYNLEINRDQLTFVKGFLDKQRKEKKDQLNDAEEVLRSYQERGGIIALDQQAQTLIQQLSQFEAQKNAAKIELMASDEVLKQYKEELKKQDPRLAEYLESATSETYITALQNEIAQLQINKDLALAKVEPGIDITNKVIEYDKKIKDLKAKLDEKVKVLKAGILASSPEEVKALSQKIIEEEIKNGSLRTTQNGFAEIVKKYEEKFNRLPKTSLDLARFQRNRESLEKLYTLVEERFQEAVINEQSQPGNVLIIDNARIPSNPAKPNRSLIVIVGLIIGFALAFGFVFIKNYFDNSIKTPEDIQKKNVNVLAWIPQVEGMGLNIKSKFDFIVSTRPDSIPSEAFRALRTRVQFSRPDKETLKTILITSPAPQEGKTTVAINFAGSFALSNKKTLIVDCDLRKPRLHQILERDKKPGLIDYLVGEYNLDQIIYPTEIEGLSIITSGTIPPNPAEMLDSIQMEKFLVDVRNRFDYVILDSPPIVAVTDAEILAKKVDGSILVVSADVTENSMLDRAIQLLKHDNSILIGAVLNNFSTKPGYGSYYKYYYYYASKNES